MMNLIPTLAGACSSYLGGTGIPAQLAHIVFLAYRFIQVFVPILLIIWGMLDLGKAVMAQKDEEIKKGQQTFIKRLVAAVIVFFITAIVKLVINLFAGADATSLVSCVDEVLSCRTVNTGSDSCAK